MLADLIKAFMGSQETVAFITKFVQEVTHFKSYVHDFHDDGINKIFGLGDIHLFNLCVEEDGNDRD